MNRTIWKFPINLEDQQTIVMPVGVGVVRTLSVGLDPQGDLCVWVQVDKAAFDRPRSLTVFVFGTGHPMTIGGLGPNHYVGTVVLNDFVWHVFTDEQWP